MYPYKALLKAGCILLFGAAGVIGCSSSASSTTDAGVAPDSGMRDSGTTADTGVMRDVGVVEDTGVQPDSGQPPPQLIRLDAADYRDKLVALWLAQCIANWTGLQTEGRHNSAPFLTDDDWINYEFVLQSPWLADDDTDIEFIYLDGLATRNKLRLTPEEIQSDWFDHTSPNVFIWVSNLAAQTMMRATPAVLPPSTSLLSSNDQSLMIDAQLTTEIFGALTPGMPSLGLDIADLPIRTTASGYSAHAAQFHVALYSLAAIVDPADSRREQILWMVRAARQLIPDGSKTADVIDVVLADYLSNPDVTDWERTRDLVAERFQSSDEANGYRYLEWYESSVNLAGGLIALLYGEGDFRQTVQIGTLSGWDSDNGTATMGGLLGLMLGTQAIRDAFPGRSLSTSYDITRTRTGFPRAIWTFEELADRMMTLAGLAATEAGGVVESNGDLSVPELTDAALQARDANPLNVLHASSVNNQTRVRLDVANAERFTDIESSDFEVIADGLETDYSGRDRRINVRNILQFPFIPAEGLCTAMTSIPDATPTVTITWSTLYRLEGIRLIEGPKDANGGSFDAVEVQARVGNTWRPMTLTRPYSPSSTRAFEIHELRFDTPVEANGLRLSGQLSAGRYATVCEFDGIIAP